jgi:hypothetical protein
MGRLDEAERLLRASVATYEASLGAEHWRTANARLYLGWVFALEGRTAEAARSMNAAYSRIVQALGDDHPRVLAARELMLEAGVEAASVTSR